MGTIGVPLSSIETHLWPSFNQFHQLFDQSRGPCWVPIVPQWYPNFLPWQVWCLSFSLPCHTYVQDVLFDLHNILKYENINLLAKIAQNLQIFKHSTNRSRSHTHTCNTGSEGSEHILFISKKFGYHWGTVRTQEIQFRFYYKIYQNLTDSTHKWNFTEKCGTQVVPKILYSKSTRSKLFNAVSTVCIAILDQKLQPT